MTFLCWKCQAPVFADEQRYKIVHDGNLTGLEHVDCADPTKGANEQSGKKIELAKGGNY